MPESQYVVQGCQERLMDLARYNGPSSILSYQARRFPQERVALPQYQSEERASRNALEKFLLELVYFCLNGSEYHLWRKGHRMSARSAPQQEEIEVAVAQLGHSWPEFLDLLDDEPEMARYSFFLGAYAYLTTSPPPAFRWLPEDRRHDLTLEVIMGLLDNNFKRLRQYRKGRRFVNWLAMVANNRAKDIWNREKRIVAVEELPEPDPATSIGASPETMIDADRVRDVIYKMDRRCRLILLGRLVREWSNKELCRLFPEVEGDNKIIGNWYRECRLKLIEYLENLGIRPDDCIDFAVQKGGRR